MLTHPTAPHKLEEPWPPSLFAPSLFSKSLHSSFPRLRLSWPAERLRVRNADSGTRHCRGRPEWRPGQRGPGGGSRLRAATACRRNYASQPAPLPPRSRAPRPPVGSRLLIAALARPRRRPCSWPRYLGADGLTARTAAPGWAHGRVSAQGVVGAGPDQAQSAVRVRSAGAAAPSLRMEDARRRRRSAGWARRAGPPRASPAPRAAQGCAEGSAARGSAGGSRLRDVGPTPCTAAPQPLQPAGPLQ